MTDTLSAGSVLVCSTDSRRLFNTTQWARSNERSFSHCRTFTEKLAWFLQITILFVPQYINTTDNSKATKQYSNMACEYLSNPIIFKMHYFFYKRVKNNVFFPQLLSCWKNMLFLTRLLHATQMPACKDLFQETWFWNKGNLLVISQRRN